MITAQELLEKYKLVEFSIIYSRHKHCRARDKMLKLCVENLRDIVSKKAFIEILARMFKAASETVNYEQKNLLYEDALDRLNNAVRNMAIKIQRRHLNANTSSQEGKNRGQVGPISSVIPKGEIGRRIESRLHRSGN